MDQQRQLCAAQFIECEAQVRLFHPGEAVDAGVDHEALESRNACLCECRKRIGIAVDDASPRGPIDRRLTACCLALRLEGICVYSFGDAVKGHIDESGDAARCCRAGGGVEAFPIAPRIIDVHMRVDQAGEKEQVAEVVEGFVLRDLVPWANRGDLLAIDDQRGGREPFVREDAS